MNPVEFITLGTAGGPTPKLDRQAPSHAIVHDGRTILVDCGEGAFGQLRRAGIDLREVHEIFLTHHHFDHIGSLFACLGLNMMLHRREPLNVYGPPGTRQILDGLIMACDVPHQTGFGIAGQSLPHPRDFLNVREITPGDIVDIDNIRVSCCENTHYRTEDKFGQEGAISLSLRFDSPTRSMVFTGDTGPCNALAEFTKGAQLLVGELINVEKTMNRIRSKNPAMSEDQLNKIRSHMNQHHLKPEELGELATRAGVEHVVAVHIPEDSMNTELAKEYVQKVATRFSGKISIGEDLARY